MSSGEPGGEHHAVVGERGGWDPVLCNGLAERGEHDRAGDPVVCGDREREPGVVIEPGQRLGVGAGSAIGAGESVVGEVALPGLLGCSAANRM